MRTSLLRLPTSALIFALAASLGPVSGCKAKVIAATIAPPAPIHVETAEVREEPISRVLALTGTLRGKQESDIAANASGRVLATLVERGAEVKSGDLLARLDVRAAALSAAEARANADITKTRAETAKRDCDRYASLLAQGAIAQADYDRVADQCSTSKESIAASQARAASAAQMVGDGMIRAPFAGVVTERYVDVGEFVRQDTKVVSLVAVDSLRLELSVPEAEIGSLKQGGKLTFTVPTFPKRSFVGTVRFISAAVRETTRDMVAEAVVDNADRALKPGMFATISLLVGEAPMPVVPSTAVVEKDGRTHVFAVIDGRLEERVVQTGATKGALIAVARGLKAGERVVAAPTDANKNGQMVN
ncbi:MAG: efflux RND transporter periplasmic adaptor subunit [Byssovorax sp.]